MTMQYYAHLQRNHALICFYQPNDGNSENTFIYTTSQYVPHEVLHLLFSSYWPRPATGLTLAAHCSPKKPYAPDWKKDWVKGIGSKPSYHQIVLVWRTVLVPFNQSVWLCVASPNHYPSAQIRIAGTLWMFVPQKNLPMPQELGNKFYRILCLVL
jgi:hypothetical protein